VIRLRGLIDRHRHAGWALADQAVVSGGNFATGILLARNFGPEAFGVFVLLQAVLFYVNAFQVTLIFSPMLSAAPQMEEGRRAAYLRGLLALQLVLSVALAALVWLLGWGAARLFPAAAVGRDVVLAVAAAILAFQLQEWLRRYYFVREDARSACLNDVISYGGQVAVLAWFCLHGDPGMAQVFWIIAATSALACTCGVAGGFIPRPAFTAIRGLLHDGWRTGRDYFVAWQMQWAGTQGILLVGAGLVGTQAAGGVRAAQNIIGPLNILFQVMENVVPVKAARRYAEDGLPGLKAYLWRNTAWGSAFLLPLLLVLALWAEPLTRFIYGPSYAAYAGLVIWQAGAMFLQFYLRQALFFMRTLQETGPIIRVGVVMAVCSVLVALLTVGEYREAGIMLALFCAVCAGLVDAVLAARSLSLRLARAAAHSLPMNIAAQTGSHR